jgi:homoserine O-acetyltransferase/O-succinyltransferase
LNYITAPQTPEADAIQAVRRKTALYAGNISCKGGKFACVRVSRQGGTIVNATMPFARYRDSKSWLTAMVLALVALLAPGSHAQQGTQQNTQPPAQAAPAPKSSTETYTPVEGDFVARDFHFKSGEALPELRLHYRTLGKPVRDASGRVTNAVMILHGTGGWGGNFLVPEFASVLYGPGQLLDITRYYIILPDNIGHGKSSKPSDGMHAHFPSYDYDDMVAAQHLLLEKGLGVNHLRLIMGTSMGCMHSWVWGETYPDFMDALMPLACLPVQIAGRNRMWRKMLMNGIREDPEWKDGDYTTEPRAGLEIATDLLLIAGSAPLRMQESLPTREAADHWLQEVMKDEMETLDANDLLYAVNSSRNYDPSGGLGKITVPVMYVNSADDFINPPELDIAEREIQKVKNGKFVLLPITEQTEGHGTHTLAAVWQQYLKELLAESQRPAATAGAAK